jgi:hypothetical protein
MLLMFCYVCRVPATQSPPATPATYEIASMPSPHTLQNNANNGLGLQQSLAVLNRHPSPAVVGGVMPTAVGAAHTQGSSFSSVRPQLGSLLLVASQLAGAGGNSDVVGSQGLRSGGSPFLPATLATLQATTASVVAAEALAAAMNTTGYDANANVFDANTGLLSNTHVRKDLEASVASMSLQLQPAVAEQRGSPAATATAAAAAAAAALDSNGNAKQNRQGDGHSSAVDKQQAAGSSTDLPSWLCSTSAGLAASKAICRASLLRTTAALARLNQPLQRHQQQFLLQQQRQHNRMLSGHLTPRAAVTIVEAAGARQQQQQQQGIAMGVPVAGHIVLGSPVCHGGWPVGVAATTAVYQVSHLQQQLPVVDVQAVKVAPPAAAAAVAAAINGGCCVAQCSMRERQPDGVEGPVDSGSCTSTPRAAGGASGSVSRSVDGETVAAAAAAARLLCDVDDLQDENEEDDRRVGSHDPADEGGAEVGSNFVGIVRSSNVCRVATAVCEASGIPGSGAAAAMAASVGADVLVTVDLTVNKHQGVNQAIARQSDEKLAASTKAVETACSA